MLTYFKSLFNYIHYFFSWRDFIEIALLSYCFYTFTTWLAHDRTSTLLRSFYWYCVLIIAAFVLDLSTINYLLFISFPAVVTLCALFHQESLQRSFIAYKYQVATHKPVDATWLERLMQRCLTRLNHEQPMRLVFEHTDDLSAFLSNTHLVNMPINQSTLDLLLTSQLYLPHQLVWIKQGTIHGYNCMWHLTHEHHDRNTDWIDEWHYQALWYTAKTDALIMNIDNRQQFFTMITRGKKIDALTVHQAHELIRQHLALPKQEQGVINESKITTHSFIKQKNP